jgi:hypothetical protein
MLVVAIWPLEALENLAIGDAGFRRGGHQMLWSAISAVFTAIKNIIFRNRRSAIIDFFYISAGLLISTVAIFSNCSVINQISVWTIDIIVAFWLLCTAVLSTPTNDGGLNPAPNQPRSADAVLVNSYLPTRPGALIVLPLFLVALVLVFANVHSEISIADVNAYEAKLESWDALYFSFATMFTLNAASPQTEAAQIAVMSEFASGFLILIAALPLLVGRITNF